MKYKVTYTDAPARDIKTREVEAVTKEQAWYMTKDHKPKRSIHSVTPAAQAE